MSRTDTSILKIKALGPQWDTSDPFLFCAHHEDFYPKGNGKLGPNPASLRGRNMGQDFAGIDGWRMYHGDKVPGFPSHPHRGFETVTVVEKGFVDHSDSMGAAGRYGAGDVQWLTAGKGVQHAEMFPLLAEEKENTLELFQIWLNLPAKKKFSQPCFKMLWNEDIPRYEEENVSIKIIAGEFAGTSAVSPPPDSWASDSQSQVAIWLIELQAAADWTLPAVEAGLNRTLYYYQGEGLEIAGSKIPSYHGVELMSDRNIPLKNASGIARLVLLQGRPLQEPVVQYGPFVMNTEQEIRQTFVDYQNTQFGGWPWPSSEHTHGKEPGRFAKHADGSQEQK